jgi:hypothetical protein
VALALVFGIPSLVAAGHYKHTPWWAVPGIVLAVIFFVVALFFVAAPLLGRRSLRAEPTPAAGDTAPAPPVNISLMPEHDMTTDRFRLVAMNRGASSVFSAEVIRVLDQDGQEAGPLQGWRIPWLKDGSVTPEEILTGGACRLDFAHFNFPRLREDLEGTKWLNRNHWIMPALPESVILRYPAVRTWGELNDRHFLLTVRIIRDDPPGRSDRQFKIGTEGTEPYCRAFPPSEESALGQDEPAEPAEKRKDSLRPGERLSAGESLYSPDGTVRCHMRKDGNLVVSCPQQIPSVLWDSVTAQTGSANYLDFQNDGNMLLCTGDGAVLIDWEARGMGGKRLVLQDDGNLDLYAHEGRTVWATDRLKDGVVVIPLRPDLRAHPKRRMTDADGRVQWINA